MLDELGIEPVEVGIMDAPTDDTAAMESSVRLIAERFKAANVDTILMVGIGAPNYMQVMADDTSYRPQLLFTETNAARAFYTSADTTDTSILEGALDRRRLRPRPGPLRRGDVPGVRRDPLGGRRRDTCTRGLRSRRRRQPAVPGGVPGLPRHLADQGDRSTRAGENLNYGTLAAAIDGLVMTSPGDPTERTYGPAPDNGSPTAYIFRWDEADQEHRPRRGLNRQRAIHVTHDHTTDHDSCLAPEHDQRRARA